MEVDKSSGNVTVKRVIMSHDCGLIINPDGLKNQIEGNIIQSVSRALMEEVKFDCTGIKSLDWSSYPIIRFPDVPEIEIVLDQPPGDAGPRRRRAVDAVLSQQPSPTRSSMPPECACARLRSRRSACWQD